MFVLWVDTLIYVFMSNVLSFDKEYINNTFSTQRWTKYIKTWNIVYSLKQWKCVLTGCGRFNKPLNTHLSGNVQRVSKGFSLTNDWPQSSYHDRLMQSRQTLEPDKRRTYEYSFYSVADGMILRLQKHFHIYFFIQVYCIYKAPLKKQAFKNIWKKNIGYNYFFL